MITNKRIFILLGLFATCVQAAQINPYTGVPEAESAAKRELALLKLQTQIQQQKVEMKKEDFKLKNLDRILRAELNKQLRDLSGESGILPARLPDLPMPTRTRAGTNSINLPGPMQAADVTPPPVETKLSAVIRSGGELIAVITRGSESVTVKEGNLAFGERVTEITPNSVMLGNRRLAIGALLHANADAQPVDAERGAGSNSEHRSAQRSAIQPALPGIPSIGGKNL